LQIKRGKANCSSFEQTWPRPFIGNRCLLIIVSFVHLNLFNKHHPAFRLLSPSPVFAFLISVVASCPSQIWPATLGGGSARRMPRGHVPVRLPRCCPLPPPREWGSAVTKRSRPSAPPLCVFLGAPWKRSVLRRPGARKQYTRARAKLADSSDARHGEAGFFSSTRRKKRSTRNEVSADSSSDDSVRRVELVDLISSGNDSGNNSGDDLSNNSGDDSEDHEASFETITHEIYHWTFTYSPINCSNALISICCTKLLHMTLTGFRLKSTSSRNRLKRRRQVLKPVIAKTAFL
jgi:hypothetical protein